MGFIVNICNMAGEAARYREPTLLPGETSRELCALMCMSSWRRDLLSIRKKYECSR